MDTHRQHDFIGNAEERSRPVYCNINETQDITSHKQYYPQDRSIISLDGSKSCECLDGASDAANCKGCHAISSVEKLWKAKDQLNVDYRDLEIGKTSNKKSMYMHPEGGGVSYWSDNVSSFSKEPTIANKPISVASAHTDQRLCGKVCLPDQVNYKTLPQPTMQLQQRLSSQQSLSYCKGRFCDEKYSYQNENGNIQTVYSVSDAPSNFLHCATDASNDQLKRTSIDHRIVNPTSNKIFSSNEQHQSPNFTRKCPQICSFDDQSPRYSNLYMSTPQFSSEKFATINEKNVHYMDRPTTSGEMRIRNKTPKLCENPIPPGASPLGKVYSHKSQFQSAPEDHIHTSIPRSLPIQHQTPFSGMAADSGRPIHYISSRSTHKEHSISNVAPTMETQPFDQYQYQRNAIPHSSANIISTKFSPMPPQEYNKEEMVFDVREIASNNRSGLFHNPYSSSYALNGCCSDSIPLDSMISNYKRESPHKYQKYAKTVKDVDSSNKTSSVSQFPPVSSSERNFSEDFQAQPHYYQAVHPNYINKLPYSSTSSSAAAASVVSKSPSHILQTSQTHAKMHHMQYSTQYIETFQSYSQTEDHHSLPVNTNKASLMYRDICENQTSSSQIACYRRSHPKMSQPSVVSPIVIGAGHTPITSTVLQASHSKKSQIPKPNYRELINQVHARRNATSEEELNMQIIKKTLNVDAHMTKSLANATKMNVPVTKPNCHPLKQKSLYRENTDTINRQVNFTSSAYRAENLQSPTRSDVLSLEPMKIERDVMQLTEKASFSPLDLSMRTIKTKADSTNHNYQLLPKVLKSNENNCSFTLPRVNFTPKFSFPTNVDPIMNNDVNKTNPFSFSETDPVNSSSNIQSKIKQANNYSNGELLCVPAHSSDTKPSIVTEPQITSLPYEETLSFNQHGGLQSMQTQSTTKQSVHSSIEAIQVRPSVLETNPYASFKLQNKDSKSNAATNFFNINQLPPETSIMPLTKTVNAVPLVLPRLKNKEDEILFKTSLKVDTVPPESGRKSPENFITPYTKSLGDTTIQNFLFPEEGNPVFLSRKRACTELENRTSNKPFIKQPKLTEISFKMENVQQAQVPVIAINERLSEIGGSRTSEKPLKAEISFKQSVLDAEKICVEENVSTLKKEPILPTDQNSVKFLNQHKTNTSSLIASRIRTKAELKGFTFIPSTLKPNESPFPEPVHIKKELSQSPVSTIAPIQELSDNYKQESLLDFSWSKTCNSFVQQLLSNSKKITTQKKIVKTEESEDELKLGLSPASPNFKIKKYYNSDMNDNASTVLEKNLYSESVENQSDVQSNNFKRIKSVSQEICILSSISQKKISKMGRDKLRIKQEKRFAARLQDGSSSETDNELDRRISDRLKKPFKKSKARQSTQIAKNRFSDCGSDSSGTDLNQLKKPQSGKIMNVSETLNNHFSGYSLEKESMSSTNIFEISRKNVVNVNGVKIEQNQQDSECPIIQQKQSQHQKISSKVCNNEEIISRGNENTQEIPDVKKVQYEDKEKLKKKISKQKMNVRVGQNTITRSKRKRELELQLANSKVLRNDKIIRNSTTTTKIKRKYVRNFSNAHNQGSTNTELFNKDVHNQLIMSTRLRSRKSKDAVKDRNKQAKSKEKCNTGKETSATKSNDHQSDILMEVYRYKRSLKIPPSLITIKHPNNHKIATSIPSLENDGCSMAISKSVKSTEVTRKNESRTISMLSQPNEPSELSEPRSIIDVLHSRVIKSTFSTNSHPLKSSKQKIVLHENDSNGKLHNTEDISGSSTIEPSTQKHNHDINEANKKRHFSIFDTTVLQSKTRTESKMQQKREIIREIFVGDERPASAPPEITPATATELKMTYEQKYEQFLQQMNVVVNDTNFCKFGKRTPGSILGSLSKHDTYRTLTDRMIKQDDDTGSGSIIDVDEKPNAKNPRDSASVISTGPLLNPCNLRRRKCGKYFRRKGSSGFDYIRKKKKPVSLCTSGSQQIYASSKICAKSEVDYEVKEKTEDDVCREIQKWVLNKGVGQSTMHKAARLGHIDIIVYCLDRLCMNPDQKDNAGYTPLHEACTNGWLEIAKILLQYGAKHSEAAHSGIRPLHEASENDHEEIVRLLLSYGADPLLATYSGQTPLMLASSHGVSDILKNHLHDVHYVGPDCKPWHFEGPWKIFDASENGYDIFSGAPSNNCDTSRALNRSFGSNATLNRKQCIQYDRNKTVINSYTEVFDNINRLSSIPLYDDCGPDLIDTTIDSESGLFEFEEGDFLLPPLYLLKDEGAEKWVLLSDLCNILKVKSKDTLLNKIYPSSSMSPAHKGLIRELKMSDFLEKATCLQLLCAGEKINICASKVVLIKYNESVRNLLGVKNFLMKF